MPNYAPRVFWIWIPWTPGEPFKRYSLLNILLSPEYASFVLHSTLDKQTYTRTYIYIYIIFDHYQLVSKICFYTNNILSNSTSLFRQHTFCRIRQNSRLWQATLHIKSLWCQMPWFSLDLLPESVSKRILKGNNIH